MSSTPARERSYHLDIFAVSLAAIVLEISYTRIFSFKLYYYFTYLVIGLALLGLGTGGVLVAIFPRLRAQAPSRLIAAGGLLGGAAVLLGYFVIAETQLNAFALTNDWREPIKLLAVSTLLFAPFLAVGIVIATIFGARPEEVDSLYGADLVGAGLGCAAAVPLISLVTPPGCVMLAGALLAAAGVRRGGGWIGMLVVVACGTGFVAPKLLPDPVVDGVKTLAGVQHSGQAPVFSRWSTVFRVDITPSFQGPDVNYIINHDGNWGSVLHKFDGDPATLGRFEHDPRIFPFRVAPADPEVLIIGAAGGHEILASLYFHARHVTGVELNPVTVSLLTEHFADYSGRLAENPRVTLVNAEGRSYLKRNDDRYDLVWFVAPDSYAAMNASSSGAFVLSESYLYTVEMIDETLEHLNDDGVTAAQFGEIDYEAKPNRTARYVASAREALRRRGVADPRRHVVVITTPGALYTSTVLVKKTPFTAEDIARLHQTATAVLDSSMRYPLPPGAATAVASPVTAMLELPDAQLPAWWAAHAYDLRPVVDDSPFFWHFARFRDALLTEPARRARGVRMDIEDLTGERVLVALLGFTIVFAGVWLLLPFAFVGKTWRAIPHKGAAALYFGALGMGFMFFEVSLIQMLTLFLGYPSYSLSVTLFGMLVFGGIGSYLSRWYRGDRRRVLLALLAGVALAMGLYRIGIPILVDRFVGIPLPLRCAMAIAAIAPLGLCLGAFMPIGLRTVAALTTHTQEIVAWAWAVNGFLSVISSILSTVLAMILGFKMLMLIAVLIYAAGVAAFVRLPVDGERGAPRSRAPADRGSGPSRSAPIGAWKTFVFALVPTVVLLAILEVAIRTRGAHEYCRGSFSKSPLWSCDPILSFKIKTTLKPDGKPLNRAGFRSREFTAKPDGVYRVLALGDSTTFGMVEESGFHYISTPYPQRLEQLIAERVGPGKVEVLNAGVPGYNSFMGVMLLRSKLRGLEPDLITVRFGWNDFLMSQGGDGGEAYREPSNPLLLAGEDLLLRTATYPYLLRLGRELRARGHPERPPTVADIPHEWKPNVPLERYEHNLRRIVSLGRDQGAEVWLLTTPHAFLTDENRGQYDKFPKTMSAKSLIAFSAIPSFDRMIEIHDQYAQATRDVGRELGVPVIDMEAVYVEHAAEHLYTSSDVVHPTQEGHELEAETLYARMVQEGIVARAADQAGSRP